MSYETKAPRIRVDKEFDEYLRHLKKRTGLPMVKCTKLLVKDLKALENKKKKRLGFDFGFKI